MYVKKSVCYKWLIVRSQSLEHGARVYCFVVVHEIKITKDNTYQMLYRDIHDMTFTHSVVKDNQNVCGDSCLYCLW